MISISNPDPELKWISYATGMSTTGLSVIIMMVVPLFKIFSTVRNLVKDSENKFISNGFIREIGKRQKCQAKILLISTFQN